MSANFTAARSGGFQMGSTATLNNTEPFTVFFWYNPVDTGVVGSGRIVVKDNNNAAGRWNILNFGVNQLRFEKGYGTTVLTILSSANQVTMNKWQPIAVTWDGTSNATTGVKIYNYGSQVVYSLQQDGAGTKNSDATLAFCIGNRLDKTRSANGKISQVAIWATTLSDFEIKLLSNSRMVYLPTEIQPTQLKAYWPLDDLPNGSAYVTSGAVTDRGKNSQNGSHFIGAGGGAPTSVADEVNTYK